MKNLAASQRAGWLLLLLVGAFALFGPALVGIDPARQTLARFLEAPSLAHPLGLDHLGRSMLARLAHGAQLSLSMAVLSVLSAAIPGTALGLLAAWRGGWMDRILGALADAVLALPGLLLVLLLAAFAPGQFWPLYLGISLALWVEYFRVTRNATASLLAGPQVEAARMLGFGPASIVRRHLAPVLLPRLATLMRFGFGGAVLAMAALGFIGVGLQPPTAELGVMMIELLPYYSEAPWLVGAPVALLFFTMLGLMLAGRARRLP
ncbi:ABC transporter permease [Janthinobacterium sp. AD80]|uniref:ABC transporter permease n=1 Tax=Janthinobacterium sp. AD80 TaxID=1528773 RepID=UPI000C86816D|nr:ABC transporter permease [Janthinobacterium sp. AD80]PMQ13471.1 Glutathione transport system permease protein GsiD [Janthinobacterium sp. AD80]